MHATDVDTVICDTMKHRCRLRDLVRLPLRWYNSDLEEHRLYRDCRKGKTDHIVYICAHYLRLLSACHGDRKYIDVALTRDLWGRLDQAQQSQLYQHIGWTLCDLGYIAEGTEYLSRAMEGKDEQSRLRSTMMVCLRLNTATPLAQRLELADRLLKAGYAPDVTSMVRTRLMVEAGRLAEAMELAVTLHRKCRCVMAEVCFAGGDFVGAAEAFAEYALPAEVYFWRHQYDYKEALTYYYLGWHDKCRKKALTMRRRAKWDRFYRVQDVEQFGVKREASVDSILNSDEPDRCLIDWESLGHYRKMLPSVLRGWASAHPLVIFTILVGSLFAVLCWIHPPWR